MWPQQQQQQGQPMPISLQPGQYPTYSYNQNMPTLPPQPSPLHLQQAPPPQLLYNNQSTSSESPISIGGGPTSNSPAIEQTFKRQSDGPILWFAGPPLNVLQSANNQEGSIHSLAYLDWKQRQQKQKNK